MKKFALELMSKESLKRFFTEEKGMEAIVYVLGACLGAIILGSALLLFKANEPKITEKVDSLTDTNAVTSDTNGDGQTGGNGAWGLSGHIGSDGWGVDANAGNSSKPSGNSKPSTKPSDSSLEQ